MVKIDSCEAFENKFEKCLSEMMCSQRLKHKDVLTWVLRSLSDFVLVLYMLYVF